MSIEYNPQQRAAIAAAALLLDGPQRAADLAARLYDSEQNGWYLLNNISAPLCLVNDRGWWYVNASPFADARQLLESVSVRVEETSEGMAYCRPLSRSDMVRMQRLLRHVLRIGQVPPPPP